MSASRSVRPLGTALWCGTAAHEEQRHGQRTPFRSTGTTVRFKISFTIRNADTTGVTAASPPLFAFHFDLAVIYLYLQKVAN